MTFLASVDGTKKVQSVLKNLSSYFSLANSFIGSSDWATYNDLTSAQGTPIVINEAQYYSDTASAFDQRLTVIHELVHLLDVAHDYGDPTKGADVDTAIETNCSKALGGK